MTSRTPPRQLNHDPKLGNLGLTGDLAPLLDGEQNGEDDGGAGGCGRRQGLGTVRIDQGEADDAAYARNRTGSERGQRILARIGRGARGDVLPVDDDETLLLQSYSNS